MKNIFLILAAFLLTGAPALAKTTTASSKQNVNHFNRIYKGYGNSFIFVEQGVEFAVFPDGQFDFNLNSFGPDFGAHVNLGNVSISFNTGYSYDAYVQYDDYGAVIQIENIPIYYDYYGRIIQAGNVHISYNRFGRIYRVGGLYVHYNRYNRYSHCTGYINSYNRHYVYRPWHSYYVIPSFDYCVVYHRPYRKYYAPVRYDYYRPYRSNSRPRSQVSYTNGRRTSVVKNSSRRGDIYRQNNTVSRRLAKSERTDSKISKRKETANSNVSRPPITSPGDRPLARPYDQQSRPKAKNRRDKNDKVKSKGIKTRPAVLKSENHKKKKRAGVSAKNQKRKTQGKSVNSNKKHKTKSVTKRSHKRNPNDVKRSKSKNNKSRATGSSSKKQRSATKRSRQ